METCIVNPSKYVVLDVETNGLSSSKHDLLSISIFKPDTKEVYNRFLPLELNSVVVTTRYNGIRTKDLVGLLPLSQKEVDEIIRAFDLKNRTILTYGALDERFMVKYFQRHHLQGIDYFAFYNFKHEIISSKYSKGVVTKDNLCNLYGIDGVHSIHSGINDCILEWKLFECMNGHHLLVSDNNVFEFNDEYIVPAGYISSYPNFKYYLPNLPRITCDSKIVFSLQIKDNNLMKFPTNFNGLILEHLINSMLNVYTIHSEKELLENKKKLKFVGKLPSYIDYAPVIFNPDGSITATHPLDQELVRKMNKVIDILKASFAPLVDFIANDIFNGQKIYSQELVVNSDEKILAKCDLSNERAVLEIKATSHSTVQDYSEQLYYEANGRKCYVLLTDWDSFPKRIIYNIHEIEFLINEPRSVRQVFLENAKKKIETEEIELIEYTNIKSPVKLRCKKCGNEWNSSYKTAIMHRPCPNCFAAFTAELEEEREEPEDNLTAKERNAYNQFMRCKIKLERRSNNQVTLASYKDSKTPAKARCMLCGNEWENRFDKLLAKPYCRSCRKARLAELQKN